MSLVGVQVDKQVVDFVQDFRGARVVTVDLVDHHDRRQSQFKRLGQHESRLGQRAFRGVDEQHDAVDHPQGAFNLATEIGVTRRVDDIDLHVAVGDGGVLRHDRDAFLALEVHRVQNPFTDVLVFAEGSTLPQHCVHERGLAVVDVRHNGDVAKIHHGTERKPPRQARASLAIGHGIILRLLVSHHLTKPPMTHAKLSVLLLASAWRSLYFCHVMLYVPIFHTRGGRQA